MPCVRRILVPVDGSASAISAARFAGRLSCCCEGEVTLLHVINPTVPFEASSTSPPVARDRKTVERIAEPFLDAAEAAVRESWPDASVVREVTFGQASVAIARMADHDGFDLVVMGSRGLSPAREILLGSVSEDVVRQTRCPVTMVH